MDLPHLIDRFPDRLYALIIKALRSLVLPFSECYASERLSSFCWLFSFRQIYWLRNIVFALFFKNFGFYYLEVRRIHLGIFTEKYFKIGVHPARLGRKNFIFNLRHIYRIELVRNKEFLFNFLYWFFVYDLQLCEQVLLLVPLLEPRILPIILDLALQILLQARHNAIHVFL